MKFCLMRKRQLFFKFTKRLYVLLFYVDNKHFNGTELYATYVYYRNLWNTLNENFKVAL